MHDDAVLQAISSTDGDWEGYAADDVMVGGHRVFYVPDRRLSLLFDGTSDSCWRILFNEVAVAFFHGKDIRLLRAFALGHLSRLAPSAR
jgi:hypothetical protein